MPSSKGSLKSQGQVLLGEVGRLDEGEELLLVLGMKGGLKVLTIFVREVKVIMATNKVVVLAGGQVEEMVVLMWEVAGGEDRHDQPLYESSSDAGIESGTEADDCLSEK